MDKEIMQQNVASGNPNSNVQHIFIIGSKSIGQYGGYETFVDKLTEQHQHEPSIKYHVACKANGEGFMDESKLEQISDVVKNKNGEVREFTYHNAHIFKIPCPSIGPAVAIYYDWASVHYCIKYCRDHRIQHPIFYILTCRIGLFIGGLVRKIHALGGKYYLNPDGHEWMRAKWSLPVRKYWKWSEKKMVNTADVVVCDSVNIENYIKNEYSHPHTTYIAYGADVEPSLLEDDDSKFTTWLDKHELKSHNYYLLVGRFVPENNYETIIREFMKSKTKKSLAIVTNLNDKLKLKLEKTLHFGTDKRIKFVGTVYDHELLKKIRECAYAYIHGHEVGGTNPSLLEALGSTQLNLLLDVGFNREVGLDSALYWTKKEENLSYLINDVDAISPELKIEYSLKAKARINSSYSWWFIGNEYGDLWLK